MIRQRFQFLGKRHNKNLPILHKGIFRGLGALFVFFGKTGDDIRNAQLYGCHINGGNKGIRHALAACVRHALELPQNDDIAAPGLTSPTTMTLPSNSIFCPLRREPL